MKRLKKSLILVVVFLLAIAPFIFPSSHREAPITALDPKADITDLYAFVSYGTSQVPNTPPSKVTLILCVDPFLEPANGPNWFPLDPEILYEINVDNDQDAEPDITFQFRFSTEQRLPRLEKSQTHGIQRRMRLRESNVRAMAPQTSCGFPGGFTSHGRMTRH